MSYWIVSGIKTTNIRKSNNEKVCRYIFSFPTQFSFCISSSAMIFAARLQETICYNFIHTLGAVSNQKNFSDILLSLAFCSHFYTTNHEPPAKHLAKETHQCRIPLSSYTARNGHSCWPPWCFFFASLKGPSKFSPHKIFGQFWGGVAKKHYTPSWL